MKHAHTLLDDYASANEEICPVVLLDELFVERAGDVGLTGGVWISWRLVEDDAVLRELMGSLQAPSAHRPFPSSQYAPDEGEGLCGGYTSPCSALPDWARP